MKAVRVRWFVSVTIQLLPTEQGGRRKPISSGYCPAVRFDGELHATSFALAGQETLSPGEACRAIASGDWPRPRGGIVLPIYEGTRNVGAAIVLTDETDLTEDQLREMWDRATPVDLLREPPRPCD